MDEDGHDWEAGLIQTVFHSPADTEQHPVSSFKVRRVRSEVDARTNSVARSEETLCAQMVLDVAGGLCAA